MSAVSVGAPAAVPREGLALEANAVLAISQRDLMKFLRDPTRLLFSFLFPFLFIAVVGQSLEQNLGRVTGYDWPAFVFTGVFAQTLFQSSVMGLVSLLDDRDNDFSQEIFVSPVSRYSILFGKVLGESQVALAQGLAIFGFALAVGVSLSVRQVVVLLAVGVLICLLGGSFGVLVVSRLSSRRAAEQIFNFVVLPQLFLAGVFNPIKSLPLPLEVLSRLSPMRYAVDLARAAFHAGRPDYARVVVDGPLVDLVVIGVLFSLCLVVGTALFVRGEQNR